MKEYIPTEDDLLQHTSCACGCGKIPKRHFDKFLPHHDKRVPSKLPRPCLCGCGQITKYGNKFIKSHQFKQSYKNYKRKVICERCRKQFFCSQRNTKRIQKFCNECENA